MRHVPILAALLLAVPAIACAQGSAPAPPPPGVLVTSTPDYLAAAAAGDLYEITSSNLVLRGEGGSAEVRRFAQMMVTDHQNATTQLRTTAESLGLRPAVPTMTPQQQAMIEQLQAANGVQRDRLYVTQQVQAHRQALALHQGYLRGGDQPALRDVARQAAQVVEGHLKQVQALQGGG